MKINWDKFDLEVIIEKKLIDLKKKFNEEIKFAKETVDENLRDQPSLFAFYAVMAELAEEIYDIAKLELELLEATLDEFYRKKFVELGEKVTEKKLSMLVISHKERVAAIKNKIVAKKNWGILKVLTKAFEQRKEALIAAASNYRAEIDPDIWIRKKELKRERY